MPVLFQLGFAKHVSQLIRKFSEKMVTCLMVFIKTYT